jgi:hypothetical protein
VAAIHASRGFSRWPWNATRMTLILNMTYIHSIFDIFFKPLIIKNARFNGFAGRLSGFGGRGMKFV